MVLSASEVYNLDTGWSIIRCQKYLLITPKIFECEWSVQFGYDITNVWPAVPPLARILTHGRWNVLGFTFIPTTTSVYHMTSLSAPWHDSRLWRQWQLCHTWPWHDRGHHVTTPCTHWSHNLCNNLSSYHIWFILRILKVTVT